MTPGAAPGSHTTAYVVWGVTRTALHCRSFIGGEFRSGQERFERRNPVDGEVVAIADLADEATVDAAVAAAEDAFRECSRPPRRPPRRRRQERQSVRPVGGGSSPDTSPPRTSV